jgi:hypothetical protein
MEVRNLTRVLLPSAQVALAVALIISNARRPNKFSDPAFRRPDWQFCLAINAPVLIVVQRSMHFVNSRLQPDFPLNFAIDWAVRLPLIWILWYGVAIEIHGRGRSVLASKTRVPILVDALAIAYAVVVLALGANAVRYLAPTYARLLAAPYLTWAIAIAGFYGHDLWASIGANSQ